MSTAGPPAPERSAETPEQSSEEGLSAPQDRVYRHRTIIPTASWSPLSDFSRRLSTGDRTFDTDLTTEQAIWLPAQRHAEENTGTTSKHTILFELKGDAAGEPTTANLGPEHPAGA